MVEYIEREAMIRRLEVTPILKYGIPAYVRDGVVDLVEKQPSADVVPKDFHEWCLETEIQERLKIAPKHGRWEDLIPKEEKVWVWDVRLKCSECGYTYAHERKRYSYCPNCGARMDGK